MSQELKETGVASNDPDMVKNELKDLNKCMDDVNTPQMKLIDFCHRNKLDVGEHVDRRKFLVTFKNLKVKVAKFLNTSENIENAENDESDSIYHLSLG